MKKVLYGIICLFSLFIFNSKVYAGSFELSLTGDSEFSNEITLDLQVSKLVNLSNGIYGIEATINYDKTKIDIVEITSTDFDITFDKTKSDKVVAVTSQGAKVGASVLSIKLKNIALEDNETTTISITNIVGSDSDNDITCGSVSKTIKYVAKNYVKGDLNGNEKIDLPDIILALKKYLNIEPLTSSDIEIADMDDDGAVTVKDIIILLKA